MAGTVAKTRTDARQQVECKAPVLDWRDIFPGMHLDAEIQRKFNKIRARQRFIEQFLPRKVKRATPVVLPSLKK